MPSGASESSSYTISSLAGVAGVTALALLGARIAYKVYKDVASEEGPNFSDIHRVTKDQLAGLLDEILENQKFLQKMMVDLQKEILEKNLSFQQVMEKVEEKYSPSPLEKHNLSVQKFSQLLSGHNSDPMIRKKIMKLTSSQNPFGGGGGGAGTAPDASHIEKLAEKHSIETVIDIHRYMLQGLKDTMADLKISKKTSPRLATIAAQAFVGKLVQFQYGLSCEELELLAAHFHAGLSQDNRFFEIGCELRQSLSKLTEMCSDADMAATA